MESKSGITLLVVALFGSFASGSSNPTLTCKFRTVDSNYACIAIGLEVNSVNASLSEVKGTHEKNKANSDVSALFIRGQSVSFLPANLADLFPKLTRLEVRNSSLLAVERNSFKDLKHLRHLILVANSIETLPTGVFSDLSNLIDLRLSGNKLNKLDSKSFEKNVKLEILLLDHNNISIIHENLFSYLNDLTKVHLQNNQIEELRELTFASNSKLEVIDASNNRLKWIGSKLLSSQLSSLSSFSFSNNDCIDEDYKTVDELSLIIDNSCFPPYSQRFIDEIAILKNTQLTLNKTLSEVEKDFEEQKKLKLSCEEDAETLKTEKNSLESEKESCTTEKDAFEADLKECNKLKIENENATIEASKNLTECMEKVEKDSKFFEFSRKMVKDAKANNDKCQLELDTINEAISLSQELNSELKKQNEELVKQLDASNKTNESLKKEVSELKLKTEKETAKNLIKAEPTKNITESKDCQRDFEKLYQQHEVLKQMNLKNEEDLKSCMKLLPGCSSFLLDCTFQTKINDYVCIAKHVSACQPGMKLSSVEGIHETSHRTKDDVTSLDISDSLFHFSNSIFEQLPRLKKLKVKASGLSTLEPPLESTQLVHLEIEGNKFSDVPDGIFSGLENLKTLHLDSNEIEYLQANSFNGLLNLLELRLENNFIADLPDRVFDVLPNLKSLSLRKNLLKSLDGNLLSQNIMLTTVRFNDNRDIKFIGSTLLDSANSLTEGDFRNTCVGRDNFLLRDIPRIKQMIRQNCKK